MLYRPRGRSYLFAVVGGVLHTNQVSIGPPIQIGVLATDVSIACVARLALTAVHGVREMSQVVATGIFVAVVASIETGVAWRAHLESPGRGSPVRKFSDKCGRHCEYSVLNFHLSLPGHPGLRCSLDKCTCLFLGGSLLHTLAIRLGAGVARRTGQTVVARLGVLTAVNAVELEAGVRDFLALLRLKLTFLR